MFSIFMMAATYLSLTIIPNKDFDPKSCSDQDISGDNITGNIATLSPKLTTMKSSTMLPSVVNITGNGSDVIHQNISTATLLPPKQNTTPKPSLLTSDEMALARDILTHLGLTDEEVETLSEEEMLEIYKDILKDKKTQQLLLKKLSDAQINVLSRIIHVILINNVESRKLSVQEQKQRVRREILEKVVNFINPPTLIQRFRRDVNLTHYKMVISNTISKWKANILKTATDYTFMAVMITLIIGEVFCSPVEKLADDFWFEFLDKIDELENYGKHRIWSSFAYMMFPLLVTIIVDNTRCVLHSTMPAFMLHFYFFAAMLGLTFLLAFFYPMAPALKGNQYKSKLIRGFGATCCRCDGLLYMLTLTLIGMTYAAYYNFMFWIIKDLNGPETIMGLCITVSTLAELPMLMFSQNIVGRIGHAGVVSISMVILALRTLYYSYLWTPWAVLPAEILHAVTHTALWCAVLSNPRFSINPNVDRSIRSILSSAYFGVGFAIGSVVAGILYDQYGSGILFRACAVLVIGWCPIFLLLHKCCWQPPERELKYTKLLQEDDLSDDEEDDWLDQALNVHR